MGEIVRIRGAAHAGAEGGKGGRAEGERRREEEAKEAMRRVGRKLPL